MFLLKAISPTKPLHLLVCVRFELCCELYLERALLVLPLNSESFPLPSQRVLLFRFTLTVNVLPHSTGTLGQKDLCTLRSYHLSLLFLILAMNLLFPLSNTLLPNLMTLDSLLPRPFPLCDYSLE